jgi:hypothetical protein
LLDRGSLLIGGQDHPVHVEHELMPHVVAGFLALAG